MRVLSLFDGYAGGLEALKRVGIKVSEYHAFEIDKHAIAIAKKNHPEIIHHGEINFMTDFSQFKGFDLLIGGSPCQGFSCAGKGLNFSDPRSQLFFEYVRAKSEIKPKRFLLENVKMKKEFSSVISNLMDCDFVEINSALVSAQNRKRLYWCNWKVGQLENRGILLKDIIEHGVVDRDKSYCIDANYWKGTSLINYLKKKRRQVVFNYSSSGRGNSIVQERFYEAEKAHTLTANGYSIRSFTGVYNEEGFRKLTPIECERLQTLEDGYTEGVSNTQRYKMLGNGWNIETIAHIFREGLL